MRQLNLKCKGAPGLPCVPRSRLASNRALPRIPLCLGSRFASDKINRARIASVTLLHVPCAVRGAACEQPRVSQSSSTDKFRQFFVHGVTSDGRLFRPSDWAERLAGVLSCYRPGGMATGRDAFIGYSPYVRPIVIGKVKCVLVDERLRDVERKAFDFVMSFARDNDLPVTEGCELPER